MDKNTKGRLILKGPRGGLYVLGPSAPTKIRSFKRGPSGDKNTKGRLILKGPRGGLYVLGPSAPTKIRSFKRAPATPRITSAERNIRLVAIRRRLDVMRKARLASMPKKRENTHARLKSVVRRVRARLAPENRPETEKKEISFCHGSASVPRKPCSTQKIHIYTAVGPSIDDGTLVGTRMVDIDIEWMRRQEKYIDALDDHDYWTAQAHTNRSHQWIGPFLQSGIVRMDLPSGNGKHIVPLWPQVRKMILDGTMTPCGSWVEKFKSKTMPESDRYLLYLYHKNKIGEANMKRALRMYRDDLKRIIAAAPKSRKKMVIYRGVRYDIFEETMGHWHTLDAFCSAAYHVTHALGYASRSMQRITILPGTPVLFAAPMNQWGPDGEYEIMVNIGTKYLIRKRNVTRTVWSDGHTSQVEIADVTIAK
jgi:hypothetical protein